MKPYSGTLLVNDELKFSFRRFDPEKIKEQLKHFTYKGIMIRSDLGPSFLLGSELNLPKFYASLVHISGPNSQNYDDFKGSFGFMFELTVNKGPN